MKTQAINYKDLHYTQYLKILSNNTWLQAYPILRIYKYHLYWSFHQKCPFGHFRDFQPGQGPN